MPKLVVLYPPPVDAAAFEKVWWEEHAPLVQAQLTGLRRLEAARVKHSGNGPFHWMAELHFDTMAALEDGTQSPGGQRAAGHALQISTGGAPTMLVVDDPA